MICGHTWEKSHDSARIWIGMVVAMVLAVTHGPVLAQMLPETRVGAVQTPVGGPARFPARQFSSKVSLEVWVLVNKSERMRRIGETSGGHTLEIPACEAWWVAPAGARVADVVSEVRVQGIPGLDLGGKTTDDDLTQLLGLTKLEALSLTSTKVTDAGVERLRGLTGLRTLNLSYTKVTDVGVAHLTVMAGLQTLDLGGTQVTNAGLAHLRDMTGLQSLSIFRTEVTDEGLEHLKRLRGLRQINLQGTKITDAGLLHLEGLTELQTLSLSYTKVTDAGLGHLSRLTALQRLDLQGTKVTEVGVAEFQRRLPGIEIKH